MTPSPFWKTLEDLPGLSAVPAIWRARLAGDFAPYAAAFLQPKTNTVDSFPCPRQCGCWHEVPIAPESSSSSFSSSLHETPPASSFSSVPSSISYPPSSSPGPPSSTIHHPSSLPHHPSSSPAPVPPLIQQSINPSSLFRATCRCTPPTCPPLDLTLAEVTPLQVNRPKLARAVCKAFACDPKTAELGLSNTVQVGAWSADAVPVILTIQFSRAAFQSITAQLAVRLQRPFILFAPTSHYLDAVSQEHLAHARAAFFPLDSHLTLTPAGTVRPPGELLAAFTPQPKEPLGENVAVQAVALLKSLASKHKFQKAPPFAVFLYYCADGMSPKEIARECRCTKGLVFIRLRWLRQKLGRHPAELRQYASQLQTISDSPLRPQGQTHRPQARHLWRRSYRRPRGLSGPSAHPWYPLQTNSLTGGSCYFKDRQWTNYLGGSTSFARDEPGRRAFLPPDFC
ncbi:MAG TPA: hypothetical protein VN578_24725 [Candidatus Binatia bacterium]|nr:hypothetical protein [Candidatus Binatia bacterium]